MKRFRVVFLLSFVVLMFSTLLYAQNIGNGKALFNDTKLGGGSTGKSCNSCHPAGKGIKPETTNSTRLEDIVNGCITGPLAGTALQKDSQQMKDIVAYIKSIVKK
ncbi:MAG: hypothetical protein HQK88_07925 [Nitrospirae bacterium]|nr:hypothetical protein [Nitrospirota bacterium]MBF0533619.1 hypothetical protein [Nitrospirota bacterium]MBF0616730.1 hypothetical protein [Nitrospirota bacterium]